MAIRSGVVVLVRHDYENSLCGCLRQRTCQRSLATAGCLHRIKEHVVLPRIHAAATLTAPPQLQLIIRVRQLQRAGVVASVVGLDRVRIVLEVASLWQPNGTFKILDAVNQFPRWESMILRRTRLR